MSNYCECGGFLGSGGIDGYAGRWCKCANPKANNGHITTTTEILFDDDLDNEEIELGFSEACVVGDCGSCKEPATGKYISDNHEFELECVSCGHVYNYSVPEDFSPIIKVNTYDITKMKNV